MTKAAISLLIGEMLFNFDRKVFSNLEHRSCDFYFIFCDCVVQ